MDKRKPGLARKKGRWVEDDQTMAPDEREWVREVQEGITVASDRPRDAWIDEMRIGSPEYEALPPDIQLSLCELRSGIYRRPSGEEDSTEGAWRTKPMRFPWD